ncbi:MAG: UvrD-helicase domain-containing protein [Propionivibrio sp.]
MTFHADLHIHSKHSRATSRDLDLEHLAWWAARKGIAVVATGDCVHPVWLAEMKDKLVPDGNGLFALRPEIEAEVRATLPPACRAPVRFMLSTEISTIYKKGERTRKVHHVVYAPDFATVDRLAASLGRIGNIASDGRPILGLDSRDLLEVVLESGPQAYLVPAHIWTPWFSALGSQSGFDSIQECYGDLADHIFAVETGLSSDPEMNWRVSSLDRYRLISNSDAHSPAKLGREATRFACAPDFLAMRHALETGDGYVGTVEFFPEEGKYHMDGHRACGVCFDPVQTIAHGGRCPVCGKPLTVGVAHRVEALADRQAGTPPPTAGAVTSLVPLPEMLAEILGSGVASQGVTRAYDRVSAALGPDFTILGETPSEDIRRVNPLLGEAVDRLRAGRVIRQAGYDGEYGVIRLFEDGELKRLSCGDLLFDMPPLPHSPQAAPAPELGMAEAPPEPPPLLPADPVHSGHSGILAALDPDQARAAAAVDGPLSVAAGPGSGKTRMLTHRLAHLILERGEPAEACLAITFTRRAAEELRERLAALIPASAGECAIHTFHSLGLAFLHAESAAAGLPADFRIADERERATALAADLEITHAKALRLLKTVSLLKRTGVPPADEESAAALAACRRLGQAGKWVDFDDLVGLPVDILESDPAIAARWRQRFRHLCVDEFQDVDARQYRLLQLLAPSALSICAIGDPNQAIYGFRGADAACFARFGQDFPGTRTLRLGRNYRSTGSIVSAAAQVIGSGAPDDITRPMQEPLTLHAAPDERAEADFVAATIESLLGGHDMLAAGRKGAAHGGDRPLGFADFAVLYRTDAQAAMLRDALDWAGIPYKKSSPAPIAGQPLVAELLDALARQDAKDSPLPAPLATRLAAAAEQLRPEQDAAGQAALAEARRWLGALAVGTDDEAQLREQVALSTEADFWDARADRVSLLTMHAAKGLEFPVVFVIGVEDGLTPFSWGTADRPDDGAAAEERRLFYVALTRAKDRLFLTRAHERAWRGRRHALPPSPFLDDIAPELLCTQDAPPRKARTEQQQYTLF